MFDPWKLVGPGVYALETGFVSGPNFAGFRAYSQIASHSCPAGIGL
jgi:hypothetical protein